MSAIALFESGLYPLYGYCPIIWLMIAVYPLYPTKNIHSKPIFIGIPSRSWGTTQVAHWCIPISLLDTPWIDDDTFLLSTIHWYPQFYCLYRHWWVNLPSSRLLPLISPHIVQNLCWLLVTLGLYYHILSSILKKKNIIHDLGIPVFRGPPEEGVVRTSQMQKGVLRWKGPGKNWWLRNIIVMYGMVHNMG